MPPPENGHAQEYGKPLKMAHAIVTDPCLSAEVLQQIEECIMFYKGNPYISYVFKERIINYRVFNIAFNLFVHQ